jgi:hypothetical protein
VFIIHKTEGKEAIVSVTSPWARDAALGFWYRPTPGCPAAGDSPQL